MNKTLSHHFKCINDDKYSKILLDIVKRLSRLKEMSRDNDIVDAMDELDIMYSELDYLLIYVKNIGRMGYVSKKADDELCKLYSIMDDIDTVLASTIKSIKNKPRENDKVQKYYYYIEKIWEDVQGQDDVSGDISRSLEKYLEIMNEEIDGVSLSEIWKKYKGSKNSFMEISKNVINKLFQQKVPSLSSLYIDIKKHQLEKIKMLGYHDSLEYIARKYAVDTQSIEVMVENAHTFISKVLKDNISFDWAQSGILSELRKKNNIDLDYIEYDKAIDFLIKAFYEQDQSFADMIIRAKKDNWVDYLERRGKMNGAYTNNIIYTGESVISMTFSNSINDVCKLAHELGHAYHGYCVSSQGYFCSDFSVITAEAFGLLCENYALIKYIIENNRLDLKKEFYCGVLETYLVNLKAFKFEYETFLVLSNDNDASPVEVFGDVLNEIGIYETDNIENHEWIFRSQNFFPDYFYYNMVYIIGEILAIKILLRLLQNKLSFSDVRKILIVSGKNDVNSLFNMLEISLHEKKLYDLMGDLDEIWRFVLESI